MYAETDIKSTANGLLERGNTTVSPVPSVKNLRENFHGSSAVCESTVRSKIMTTWECLTAIDLNAKTTMCLLTQGASECSHVIDLFPLVPGDECKSPELPIGPTDILSSGCLNLDSQRSMRNMQSVQHFAR